MPHAWFSQLPIWPVMLSVEPAPTLIVCVPLKPTDAEMSEVVLPPAVIPPLGIAML